VKAHGAVPPRIPKNPRDRATVSAARQDPCRGSDRQLGWGLSHSHQGTKLR
jgi:hypothetical protein